MTIVADISLSEQIAALPDSYQIRSILIRPNIVLAPMVGVTDSVFRRMILRLGGCGLVCGEMTNAASVSPLARRRHHQLDYLPEERPITMQLSGNDPRMVAEAAKVVEELGADVLDINCGCPSPKVNGGGHGAALLRDLPKMGELLRAVRAAISIPITLKFRAGWDDQSLNYLDTARLAEDCGVSALALHPRTKAQGYKGEADWSRVGEVKQVVSIPVIGSGDVKDAPDALRRLAMSGADGVMIGRAAMANPWIFRQVAQFRNGEPLFQPLPVHKRDFLLEYLGICLEEMHERLALNKLKQIIGQFSVGLPHSTVLRSSVHRSATPADARAEIERFFEPWLGQTVLPPLELEQPEELSDVCGG